MRLHYENVDRVMAQMGVDSRRATPMYDMAGVAGEDVGVAQIVLVMAMFVVAALWLGVGVLIGAKWKDVQCKEAELSDL